MLQEANNMLSNYSTHRDQYGIPVIPYHIYQIFPEASGEQSLEEKTRIELHRVTGEIRGLLQEIEFQEKWMLPQTRSLKSPSSEVVLSGIISPTADKTVSEELAKLGDMKSAADSRWLELVSIVGQAMGYTIRNINHPPIRPIGDELTGPWTLMRVWTNRSHSTFSKYLGFRCSDWKACQPFASFQALQNGQILTTEALRNHCENKGAPSSWISLCESVTWILKFAKEHNLHNDRSCTVAILSVQRLERLGVLCERSDALVRLTGGNAYSKEHPTGVNDARKGHYLAYGFIPAQCVLATLTLDEFRALSSENDIAEDTESDVHIQPPSSAHQFDPIAYTDTFNSYPGPQGNH